MVKRRSYGCLLHNYLTHLLLGDNADTLSYNRVSKEKSPAILQHNSLQLFFSVILWSRVFVVVVVVVVVLFCFITRFLSLFFFFFNTRGGSVIRRKPVDGQCVCFLMDQVLAFFFFFFFNPNLLYVESACAQQITIKKNN